MLTYTQQLDSNTLSALRRLRETCGQVDGNAINIYHELLAQPRTKPCTLLYYKNGELIGFAAVFFFEHNAGEIALFVHPSHRKQGIGQTLLQALFTSLQEDRPVGTVIFSAPHGLHDTAFLRNQFQYQGSEYEMQRESDKPLTMPQKPVEIRLATAADIDTLREIDNQCFPTSPPCNLARFHALFERPEHALFVAVHEQTIIGKAHLAWHDQTAHLSDIGILPAHQGHGFGRTLITHCINHARTLPKKTISLSVETSNQHALQLYLHLGFTTTNAIDYWAHPFNEKLNPTKS